MLKDWVEGSLSSVNFDEIVEAEPCIVVAGAASTFGFMRTLDECSSGGLRGGSQLRKFVSRFLLG